MIGASFLLHVASSSTVVLYITYVEMQMRQISYCMSHIRIATNAEVKIDSC